MSNDSDNRPNGGDGVPRPMRALAILVIFALLVAIALLASGAVKMSPVGGP